MKNIGIGKLTHDPVLESVGNTKVCRLVLSVSEQRKIDGENRLFNNILTFDIWDKGAEYIAENALSGDHIYVESTPRSEKEYGDLKTIFRIDTFRLFKS